ncbi:hypothetical protein [Streptomyces africanus]|uniref:hypothetical protein n=1 Tax=Streptomyces africanus TaxID=231024 RepID=UPI000A3B7A08|nr:hypothetical protein [Streptomyces africanus]
MTQTPDNERAAQAVRIAAKPWYRQLYVQVLVAIVTPSSWTRLARRCGAVVAPIEPTAHLHVAMVSLPAHLTPAARAFLALTRSLAQRRVHAA